MKRIEKLQNWMKKEKIEALLLENPIDLFYLTGLRFSAGKLFLTCKAALHFVDGRYYEKARKESPCLVHLIERLQGALDRVKRVGFDSAFLSVDQHSQYKKKYPKIEWIPLSSPLEQFRLIKGEEEIAALKKAAQITWEGYQHLLPLLKEGIKEKELALEFEFFCKKNGASGFSFEPIIAFGENSAYPHYRAGEAKLKKNQIVLIDVGAIFNHYCGDMTRVSFFGNPDPQLQQFHQWVREAQAKALSRIRPGVRLGELDDLVREEFSKNKVLSLYIHSLGHGIGLEPHESPRVKFDGPDKDLLLQPGMVITIEPGLYQVGLGGVRHEDTVLVTDTGIENFFPSKPDA